MIIYLAVWGIITFLLYIADSKIFLVSSSVRKTLPIVAGTIYICFAVFRDTTSNPNLDIYYYNIYYNNADMPLTAYLASSTLEAGYTLLEWIIYQIFGDFKVLLLFAHILVYTSTLKLIKEVKLTSYTFVWIACLTLDLFTSFYLVRNSIAISIGIFVFFHLKKKKYIKAILLSLLAITIHNASLILLYLCVLVYLFNKRKMISKRKLFFFGCITVSSGFILAPFLTRYFASNEKYFVYANSGAIGIRFYLTAFIIWMLALTRINKVRTDKTLYKTALIWLTGVLILLPFQLVASIVYRMTLYFQPIIYYLMIKLLDSYKTGQLQFWISRALGLLTLGISLYTFITNTIGYIGNPYIWAGF